VLALPIVGEFLQRVHKDPNIKVERSDKFIRPAVWTEIECEESVTPTPGAYNNGEPYEDEAFQ
jgi:hypothetical protein